MNDPSPSINGDHLETIKLYWEVGLTVLTGLLVVATGFLAKFTCGVFEQTRELARETHALAKDAEASSYRQIGALMWIEFIKRFDSQDMLKARARLSRKMHEHGRNPGFPFPDSVPNFFEDLGAAHRLNLINHELARGTFGYFACRWWEAISGPADE